MPRESLSLRQVAEVLGCHRDTVYRLVGSGKLPSFTLGQQIRIAKVDLLAYRQTSKYQRRKKGRDGRTRSVQSRPEKATDT